MSTWVISYDAVPIQSYLKYCAGQLVCRFAYCGRLVGHNGAVCALSSSDGTMVTGSRDRLIKVIP